MRTYSAPVVFAATMICAAGAHAGPYQDAVLADNPSAYYRFEDASTDDGELAADSSSPNTPAAEYHAIPGPITTTTGPIVTEPSTALDLFNEQDTGQTQHVSVADPAIAASGNYTIEWWAKVQEAHGGANNPNGGVMVSWYSAIAGGYEVGYNGATDKPYISFWAVPVGMGQENVFIYSDLSGIAPAAPENLDEWFHYALVFSGSNDDTQNDFLNFYINGQSTVSLANFSHNGMNPASYIEGLYMGQAYSNRQFLGQIDEVAVYQAALTAEQIAAHYAASGLAALDGDYNGDGAVDAADYVVWRNSPDDFGGPDGYDTFVKNFGQPGEGGAGGGLSSRVVPEPSSAVLICIAAGFAFVGLRRPAASYSA